MQTALRTASSLSYYGKSRRIVLAPSASSPHRNLDFCGRTLPSSASCYSTSVDIPVEPTPAPKSLESISPQRVGLIEPPNHDAIALFTPSGVQFVDNSTPGIHFHASQDPHISGEPQKNETAKLFEKFIASKLNSSIFVPCGAHRGVFHYTVFYESRDAAEKIGQLLDKMDTDNAGEKLLPGWTIRREPNIDILWAVRTRHLYIPKIPRAPAQHPRRGPGSDAETRRWRAFSMLVGLPGVSQAVRVRPKFIIQRGQFDDVLALLVDVTRARQARSALNNALRRNPVGYPSRYGGSNLPPYGHVLPALVLGWDRRNIRTLGSPDNIYLPHKDIPQHGERTLKELKELRSRNPSDEPHMDVVDKTTASSANAGLPWLPHLANVGGRS